MLKIIYYVNSGSGESQVRNELKGINKDAIRAKIQAVIVHVAENNGITSAITTKNIRGFHFSEIRIKVSRNLYRILYFIWMNEKMVLLYLFVKKEGEETPQRELKLAEEKYNDFINNTKLYE